MGVEVVEGLVGPSLGHRPALIAAAVKALVRVHRVSATRSQLMAVLVQVLAQTREPELPAAPTCLWVQSLLCRRWQHCQRCNNPGTAGRAPFKDPAPHLRQVPGYVDHHFFNYFCKCGLGQRSALLAARVGRGLVFGTN